MSERDLLLGKVLNVSKEIPKRYFVGNKQKGEFRNGGHKKTKHAKFLEKRAFLISG